MKGWPYLGNGSSKISLGSSRWEPYSAWMEEEMHDTRVSKKKNSFSPKPPPRALPIEAPP